MVWCKEVWWSNVITFNELSKNAPYRQTTLERSAQAVTHRGFEQEKIKIGFRDDKPSTTWKSQVDDSPSEFQGKNSSIKDSLVQGLDQDLKHIKGFDDRSPD
jgi:hypothetical protein